MCTLEKCGNVYILTLTGTHDHRLNPTLLDALSAALHRIKTELTTTTSSALITTAQGKYFSNGLDLSWAKSDKSRHLLMSAKLKALIHDLISLPLPTVAAVTGHAAAAGMVLALSHDYVVMRKDRGFLYMSEMDIGLVVPKWMVEVLRAKMGSGRALRDVVLRGQRVTGEVAVREGMVDVAFEGAEETMRKAVELGGELAGRGWEGRVYGENRRVVFGEVVRAVGVEDSVEDIEKAGVISRL